ncbi:putative phage tail protein [Symbiobacterium terraclitae]|uniref:putative phage tail protein n=1 Tax=Symbiobacterium terraclitae TaxID=557451 RepID=UPI0035B51A6C
MTDITSPAGRRMLGYLPPLYEVSRTMKAGLQAEGVEIDALRQAIDDALNQRFVRTTTWSLDDWERELGLPPAADQPVGERRDRIVSRIRGYGTATVQLVKQVAESYDQGTVDVIPDPPAYTVTVRFVDTRGIPPNLQDLQAAVRAVLPAHLDVRYEFRYFLWSDLDALNITWDDWDALGLTWDEVEVYH